MNKIITLLLCLLANISLAMTAGDECALATAIPVNGSCMVFDNFNATASSNPTSIILVVNQI